MSVKNVVNHVSKASSQLGHGAILASSSSSALPSGSLYRAYSPEQKASSRTRKRTRNSTMSLPIRSIISTEAPNFSVIWSGRNSRAHCSTTPTAKSPLPDDARCGCSRKCPPMRLISSAEKVSTCAGSSMMVLIGSRK